MSGLFGPKVPGAVPIVNPSDVQNRQNDALARLLSAGGTNADNNVSSNTAPVGGQARPAVLTGLS